MLTFSSARIMSYSSLLSVAANIYLRYIALQFQNAPESVAF